MHLGSITSFIAAELESSRKTPLPMVQWVSDTPPSLFTTEYLNTTNKQIIEIGEGLTYLHHEHIIHGDLRGVSVVSRLRHSIDRPTITGKHSRWQ